MVPSPIMAQIKSFEGQLLRVDLNELAALAKLFRGIPKTAQKAVAQVLNDLAFAARTQIPRTLATRLIIRDPRFVQSRIRVSKAAPSQPIDRQKSEVGSVAGPRFSGWRELQHGGEPPKNRVASIAARGGNKRSKVRTASRMKSGKRFAVASQFDATGGSDRSKVQMMIRLAAAGGLFIVPQGGRYGLSPGLYRVARGKMTLASGRRAPKIQLVQHLGRKPKGQRFDWIRSSARATLKANSIGKLFGQAMEKLSSPTLPH